MITAVQSLYRHDSKIILCYVWIKHFNNFSRVLTFHESLTSVCVEDDETRDNLHRFCLIRDINILLTLFFIYVNSHICFRFVSVFMSMYENVKKMSPSTSQDCDWPKRDTLAATSEAGTITLITLLTFYRYLN